MADLLSMDVDLVFYDTTSIHFEVDREEGLRWRGYSKEGRPDSPQVIVGMAVTREGEWRKFGETASGWRPVHRGHALPERNRSYE